ncbi:MAG: ABC transporter ATP-binding protein [Streptosporangiaceae bacterium]
MSAVIETTGLGKAYRRHWTGRHWALRDCTLAIPAGRIVGLVGPNGAGKTTLLNLAVGLLTPTAGSIEVLGRRPDGRGRKEGGRARGDGGREPPVRGRGGWGVGFVAQDTPMYSRLTVADHLRLGGWLNPDWDGALAERRIGELGLDPGQRAGSLSGGERAQVALTMAIARHPELMILDEPVASLDPLARREFLGSLMEAVAEHGVSVVLSSHLVADLERVCDYLIVLVASRVQVAGDVGALLGTHCRLSGPRRDPGTLPAGQHVVEESHTDKQSTLLVRTDEPILDPSWTVRPVTLEDLVLAYMSQTRRRGAAAPARGTRLGVVS